MLLGTKSYTGQLEIILFPLNGPTFVRNMHLQDEQQRSDCVLPKWQCSTIPANAKLPWTRVWCIAWWMFENKRHFGNLTCLSRVSQCGCVGHSGTNSMRRLIQSFQWGLRSGRLWQTPLCGGLALLTWRTDLGPKLWKCAWRFAWRFGKLFLDVKRTDSALLLISQMHDHLKGE